MPGRRGQAAVKRRDMDGGTAVALSAAERQRRSRAHKKGDHSHCDPERCDAVTTPVTETSPTAVTSDVTDPELLTLGHRGRRLVSEVLAEHPTLGRRQRVLLEECARAADRCERLDRILLGDLGEWARVEFPDTGTRFVLVIDKTLAEARQQQAILARLLSELRQSLAPAEEKPSTPAVPVPAGGGGKLADLTARIAARRGAAPAG